MTINDNMENSAMNPMAAMRLDRFGLSPQELDKYDILVLPENLESAMKKEDLRDAEHGIDLGKLLKQSGITCANSYDLDLDIPALERRSGEIWLGLVWLLNEVAVPTFVDITCEYLKQHFRKVFPKAEPPGAVNLELNIARVNDVTNLKYRGDPETLIKILGTLKQTNGTED